MELHNLSTLEARARQVKANNPKDRTWLAISFACVFAATVMAAMALSFLYNIVEGRI